MWGSAGLVSVRFKSTSNNGRAPAESFPGILGACSSLGGKRDVPKDFGEPVVFRKMAIPLIAVMEDVEEEKLCCNRSARSRSVSPESGLCRKVRSARRRLVRQ